MKHKQAWIGLIISVVFLYLAFRKSDFGQIWGVVLKIRFEYLLLILPVIFLTFFFRALRWRYLLLPAGRPGLHSLFGAMFIGFMSLNVLPLRLGEFVRAYVLGRRENLPKSGVFATVVVERIFDGFTVLLFLMLTLFFLPADIGPEAKSWIRAFSYLAVAIYLSAIALVVLMKLKTELAVKLAEGLLRGAPRLRGFSVAIIRSFATGLEALGNIKLLFIIGGYSILVWLCSWAGYWAIMLAFQSTGGQTLAGQVGGWGAMFVLVAIALGIMIPSSPGFVGTFELACITALAALGVPKTSAESFAIISHAAQYIPVTLIGIIYLYAHNFTLREIKKRAEEAGTGEGGPSSGAGTGP